MPTSFRGMLMEAGNIRWTPQYTGTGDVDKVLNLIVPFDLASVPGYHSRGGVETLNMEEFFAERTPLASLQWISKTGTFPLAVTEVREGWLLTVRF
jgi:hypothetical protein